MLSALYPVQMWEIANVLGGLDSALNLVGWEKCAIERGSGAPPGEGEFAPIPFPPLAKLACPWGRRIIGVNSDASSLTSRAGGHNGQNQCSCIFPQGH